LTAVEGKRSTAMVVLDNGGRQPAAVLFDDGGGDEQRQRWRRMYIIPGGLDLTDYDNRLWAEPKSVATSPLEIN
jgi:hypothetical protein